MFTISLLAVTVAVLSMCSVFIMVEQYDYLVAIGYSRTECEEPELNSGLSSIWDPFKDRHSDSASIEIKKSPEKKHGTLKSLVYCLIVGGVIYLITLAVATHMSSIKSISVNLVKNIANLQDPVVNSNNKDNKDNSLTELEKIYEELFEVFHSNNQMQTNPPTTPSLQNDEGIVESFRSLIIETVDEMKQQYDARILQLKSDLSQATIKQNQQEQAQKTYESEVQKDFKFMLAVKDSTIQSLRMSLKEQRQHIMHLKNTLMRQNQSCQQSSELVQTLKDGLLIQHKMKEQLSVEIPSNSTYNLAISMKCLEDYYSKYEKGRVNTIHWVDQDDLLNFYIERGAIGKTFPPIPRMGLLSLPWSEDDRSEFSNLECNTSA